MRGSARSASPWTDRRRSTIVFANSRRLAERLTARFNEIATERAADPEPSDVPGGYQPGRGSPAEIMAQSGESHGAPQVVARAHHGSVSKEQRALIEDDLKAGRLPCVVATSSLELGIDMGAVDLVVQIESPPSVASALQRVGRAGHQVGEVSRGVLLPKHRADLVHTAVAVERMRVGAIESLRVPANPLDILAQQVVAATSVEEWPGDELFELVRRAAPYSSLPRSAFDATLDLLSGRYRHVPGPIRRGVIAPLVERMPVVAGGRGLRTVRWAQRFLTFAELGEEEAFRRSYTLHGRDDLVEKPKSVADDAPKQIVAR